MEAGECPVAAARRELYEEAGILAENLLPFWEGVRRPPASDADVYWHVYWTRTRATQRDVRVGEGQAMRFVPVARVGRLRLAPNTRFILARFFASPEYGAGAGMPS
jgi:8-oxo-dGTP diphosphatase